MEIQAEAEYHLRGFAGDLGRQISKQIIIGLEFSGLENRM